MNTEGGYEMPESDEDAAFLHRKYDHEGKGYGDDWMKCQTPRCVQNFQLAYYTVSERCPLCGQKYRKKVRAREPQETQG